MQKAGWSRSSRAGEYCGLNGLRARRVRCVATCDLETVNGGTDGGMVGKESNQTHQLRVVRLAMGQARVEKLAEDWKAW